MLPFLLSKRWSRFWMGLAGLNPLGRFATKLASLFAPPFYDRRHLGKFSATGYISPTATIHHANIRLSRGIYIDDRVLIYQDKAGGAVELSENVLIYRDSIIQTGLDGSVKIGSHTHIQPRCQFSAYKSSIQIGNGVEIAPCCAFYPYNHGLLPGKPIRRQPLETKGDIIIEDEAWLGFGVIVLDGLTIGEGAVIGAGAVVTQDIPADAIAVGNPARVIKMRSDLTLKDGKA